MTAAQMESTTSADGTTIAYWRSGRGDPLVLVHGTTADHTRWHPLLPALEAQRAVCAMDRRGRGGSGDADGYTIAAEFADVAAVIEAVATATGKPVDLLGHSYGAVCALEATRLTARVRRLVLYEPPLLVEHPPGQVEGLRSLLAEGRRDDLVVTFMREVAGLDDRALAATRAAPSWANRVAAAHTLVRELRVDDGYTFDPAVFASMATPTLLLVGSDSAGFLQTSTERLAEALPDCRVVELPGQSHNAMDTAPELFTDAVLAFLGEA